MSFDSITEAATRRLHLDTMAPRQRERVKLFQGALTYRDSRLAGFDAATVVEVIELCQFEGLRNVRLHTRSPDPGK